MIIQVVIGVVIGGIILYNLPAFIALGIFGVVAIVGLAIAGAFLYWLSDNPWAILLLMAAVAGILLYRRHEQKQFEKSTAGAVKKLEDQIAYRLDKGYDVAEQRVELQRLKNQLAAEEREKLEQDRDALMSSPEYTRKLYPKPHKVSVRDRAKEIERRKMLGYDD